jgi:short-subunit dehydrogenase
MTNHKTTALVTGASAGLGAEFCRQLAGRCEVIIAVARRGQQLQALATELADRAEVHVVEADLASIEGVARTVEALRQRGPVDYLVNNAGFSTFGSFVQEPVERQHRMVRLHIDAAVALCRAALPFMRELGGGTIINVSSIGAFMPFPNVSVYGATKSFLNHFSEALQQDVVADGIRVQALCPGYTRTEIHYTDSMTDFDPARVPAAMWMEAPEVVSLSLAALATGPVVLVPGEGNRAAVRASLQAQLDALLDA